MSDASTISREDRKTARHSHTNQAETAAAPAAPAAVVPSGTVSLEIAGLQVTLPVKFAAGMTLTETQAKVLDAAYQRQFTNNQNASAKSRSEALAKAKTDEEKAAKAPLSAAQIAALYADYEPAVGGTPRLGQLEKLRHDAAWRAWVALVGEHNEAVKAGSAPVIVKAGAKAVNIQTPPRKAKDATEEAHKAALEAFANAKTAFIERFLSLPEYAARVQAQLDAILAERGTKKPDAAAAAETVGADELF